MGFNPFEMMQFNNRFNTFGQQHPRVIAFFEENGHELREGTVVEIRLKTPEGKEMITNMRLTPDDVQTLEMIKKML